MQGIYAVLTFPLITFVGYGAVVLMLRGNRPRWLGEHAQLVQAALYPLLLLIPMAELSGSHSILLGRQSAIAAMTGSHSMARLLAGCALGLLLACVLFLMEGWWLAFWRKARRQGQPRPVQQPAKAGPALPFSSQIPLAVAVVFLEEVLWRGYLIGAVVTRFHSGVLVGVVASGAAFGINHYYGGLNQILVKTLLGVVWGALFVWTASLLVPLVSHLVFDALVIWYQWTRNTEAPDTDEVMPVVEKDRMEAIALPAQLPTQLRYAATVSTVSPAHGARDARGSIHG